MNSLLKRAVLAGGLLAASSGLANADTFIYGVNSKGQCFKYETSIGSGSNTYRFQSGNVTATARFVNNGQRMIQNFANALKPVARRVLKDSDAQVVMITSSGNRKSSVTYGLSANPVIVGNKSLKNSFINCRKIGSATAADNNEYTGKGYGKDIKPLVRALGVK